MSAPAACPVCGTKLQPDWESCPNCPMSFRDAPPEKTPFQNDNFRNFGIPAIIFGGLAFVFWTASQFMWRTAQGSTETVSTLAKQFGKPPSPKAGGPMPSDNGSIQGMVDAQLTHRAPLGFSPIAPPKPAAVEEGPGTISIMPGAGPKRKAVKEWKMRGVIYDLITLKPVPGVLMTLTDNDTNSRAEILSDRQGRYRALLPALSGRGYIVTLSKSGYEPAFLDPETTGVSAMPLARRQALAKDLYALIAAPFTLWPPSEAPLVTDFHLAPK